MNRRVKRLILPAVNLRSVRSCFYGCLYYAYDGTTAKEYCRFKSRGGRRIRLKCRRSCIPAWCPLPNAEEG